jgi:hypothetical protein
MFNEKGIILKSALASNVKAVLALWPTETPDVKHIPLVKVIVGRRNAKGLLKSNILYKAWLDAREIRAVISTLERAAGLMDEYAEGTLDLTHLLAEDEDIRLVVSTESTMKPTIDGMFDMSKYVDMKEGSKREEEDF